MNPAVAVALAAASAEVNASGPAQIPDHVSDRQVGEREPQHHEQQHGAEFHALGKGADDQCRCNCRKGQLEGDVDVFRNDDALAESCHRRVWGYPEQEGSTESSEECVALGERDAVAVDRPQDPQQGECREYLHQHGEHVLRTDHATVEQSQAGDGHQDNQHGGDDHPGGVTLVRHRGGCRCRGGRRGSRCSGSRCGVGCLRFVGIGRYGQCNGSAQGQKHQNLSNHDILPIARPRRSRRCGCGQPVRGRTRRSCRRRSCRCWRIFRWPRSPDPATRS